MLLKLRTPTNYVAHSPSVATTASCFKVLFMPPQQFVYQPSGQQFVNNPSVQVFWLGVDIQNISNPHPLASTFKRVFFRKIDAIPYVSDKAHVSSSFKVLFKIIWLEKITSFRFRVARVALRITFTSKWDRTWYTCTPIAVLAFNSFHSVCPQICYCVS